MRQVVHIFVVDIFDVYNVHFAPKQPNDNLLLELVGWNKHKLFKVLHLEDDFCICLVYSAFYIIYMYVYVYVVQNLKNDSASPVPKESKRNFVFRGWIFAKIKKKKYDKIHENITKLKSKYNFIKHNQFFHILNFCLSK